MAYHFGIPSNVVFIGHIVLGILLAYIGYYRKMDRNVSMLLVVLGVMAAAYHGHLYFISNTEDHSEKEHYSYGSGGGGVGGASIAQRKVTPEN